MKKKSRLFLFISLLTFLFVTTASYSANIAGNASSVAAPRGVGGAYCAQTTGYDVIIIGAGLAGLTAAKELRHLGRSVLLVLEATDRIGGRGSVGYINVPVRKNQCLLIMVARGYTVSQLIH